MALTRKITQYGEFWILGSIFGFAGANFFDRVATISVDPLVGPVLKNFPSLLFALFLLAKHGTWREVMPNEERFVGAPVLRLFVLTGVFATCGLLLYFSAISLGGVVITPPFLQTQVLWATLFGWIFLSEKFGRIGLCGFGVVVAGLMTLSYGQSIGRPVSQDWALAIPLALGGAAFYALTGPLTRKGQLEGAHQSTGMFVRFASSILCALIVLILAGRWSSLFSATWSEVGSLLMSGVLSGPIAVYSLFIALRLMSVGRAYALNSLNTVVGALLGVLFLGEYINGLMILGILLACLGVGMVQVFKPAQEHRV